MAPKKKPPIERFMNMVKIMDYGCWQWTGYIGENGYVRHWVDGKNVLAHRWSYEYHVGPIPPGLVIDHLCRNKSCVNPDHLEPVTTSENVLRGVAPSQTSAWFSKQTHCPNGHEYTDQNISIDTAGYRNCLTCKKQRAREHYLKNREKVIDRSRQWRSNNPDRYRELCRESQKRARAKKSERTHHEL